MRRVHLLESRFRSLILEAMNPRDIHAKYYSDIPWDDFSYIALIDPTLDNNQSPPKLGKYTKWMLGMYRRGTFKRGDFNEAVELLAVFEKYKNRVQVRDITQLHSIGELYQVVKPFMKGNQATSKSDETRRIKQGAEKVYEDSQWLVIVPHTMEAAQLYGKHTQWCTAAEKSDNMFEYYNENGTLYINIDKVNNRKYQFHFESNQFMDEQDEPIEPDVFDSIGASKGLIEFYEGIFGAICRLCTVLPSCVSVTDSQMQKFKVAMEYANENEGYIVPNAYVIEDEESGRMAYVNDKGKLLCGWFSSCEEFRPVNTLTEHEVTADVKTYASCERENPNDDIEMWGVATYNIKRGSVTVGNWVDKHDRNIDAEWLEDNFDYIGYWYVDPESVWDENDEWA